MNKPTKALIDIDQLVYATACVAQGKDEPDHHILHTAKLMLDARIKEVMELCPTVEKVFLFISDKSNFRNNIAKEKKYKGQRPPKPDAYELVRDYIIKRGASSRPWMEADDVTAMNHWASHVSGKYDTVLVDQDKDLDQIPGHRIVPSLRRGGKEVRQAELKFITPEKGQLSFYKQLLMGDSTDNIGGCLLYTSPSPRDRTRSRMPSSA